MATDPELQQKEFMLRLMSSALEAEQNRQASLQREREQTAERQQYTQMNEQSRQQQLQWEQKRAAEEQAWREQQAQWQHEQQLMTLANNMRNSYSQMLAAQDRGDVNAYTLAMKNLQAQAGLMKGGGSADNAKILRDLQAAKGFYEQNGGPQAGAWTPDTLQSALAPFDKTMPYLRNPAVQQYLQAVVAPGAKPEEVYAQMAGQYAPNPGLAQLQQQMADLQFKPQNPELRQRLQELALQDPSVIVEQLRKSMPATSSQSAPSAPTLSPEDRVLQALTQNPTKTNPTGVVGGTISGPAGTFSVPTYAGDNTPEQHVLSKVFDEYNAGKRYTAPAVERLVSQAAESPSSSSSPELVTPSATVPAVPIVKGREAVSPLGTPAARSFDVDTTNHALNDSFTPPSNAGLMGVTDLRHKVAADATWNGPRSDEIRERLATQSPDAVKGIVAMHALRTGIPFEHLYQAGVEGGFIPLANAEA